jgi:pimeloyl-ACP methyl ester carboxylesterase
VAAAKAVHHRDNWWRAGAVFRFHGTHDTIVPYAHAARLKSTFGGWATMVTLSGAGHHFDFSSIASLVWRALGRPWTATGGERAHGKLARAPA